MSLLLGSGGAQVPSTSPASTPPTLALQRQSAKLSAAEQQNLAQVYQKLRPATVRLEECGTSRCRVPDGVGTGFLISADGLLLTAYHVVFQAKQLTARTLGGERYNVQVVGFNDQNDLALLRLVSTTGKALRNLPHISLAPQPPKVGEAVLSIGNGNDQFLRKETGRLMGLSADAGRADFPPNTLEVDAFLVPGDSGGPLLNARGQAVGVVSYIRVKDGVRPQITAYAVPITQNDPKITALKKGEKQEAPIIGVSLGGLFTSLVDLPATEFGEVMGSLGLGHRAGAFFTGIAQGSPAEKAGLRPLKCQQTSRMCTGDLVLSVNDKRINNFTEFQYIVRQYKPGETIKLRVWRGGAEVQLKLTLEARSALRN